MPELEQIETAFNKEEWPRTVALCRDFLLAEPPPSQAIQASLRLAYALFNKEPPDLEDALKVYRQLLPEIEAGSHNEALTLKGLGYLYRERQEGSRIENLLLSTEHFHRAIGLPLHSNEAVLGAMLASVGFNYCELSRLVAGRRHDYLKRATNSLSEALVLYSDAGIDPHDEPAEARSSLEWAQAELRDGDAPPQQR